MIIMILCHFDMKDNSKLIIASLKVGKEIKLSQRDFLVVSQYAESVGMNLEVVRRDKKYFVVKAKYRK